MNKKEEEKTKDRLILEVIGSAFIEEIGGENSSLFELSSLPLLLRELHDECLKNIFRPIGTHIIACGDNYCGQLGAAEQMLRTFQVVNFLVGLKIVQIACGHAHNMILLEAGDILSCGWNSQGQLGLGDNEDRSKHVQIAELKGKHITQIACGIRHSMALTEEGIAYSWGYNGNGELGLGEKERIKTTNGIVSYNDKAIPTQIEFFNGMKITKIFCGPHQSFVAASEERNGISEEEVFAFGQNESGQLGVGKQTFKNPTPQKVLSLKGLDVLSFACGLCFSLALTSNGEVLFCGDKVFGDMLHSEIQNTFQIVSELPRTKFVSIACGTRHCVALEESGELFAWGSSPKIKLQNDFSMKKFKPEKAEALNGKKVIQISSGGQSILELTDKGELFGWGSNDQGQLGLGNRSNKDVPIQIPLMLKEREEIIKIYNGSFSSLILIK